MSNFLSCNHQLKLQMKIDTIPSKIYTIWNQNITLDFDLAELYKVQTKNLNLAVKRNIDRFPKGFMFRLSKDEWKSLRLQIETSNGRSGASYLTYAFREQGLVMLSGLTSCVD